MDKASVSLTVFFEGPFWVGVFERVSEGKLSVCKITFGAQPSDGEVWELILHHYSRLRFSPAIDAAQKKTADNPKRRQRTARKQMQAQGIGTKSQQALQMQRVCAKNAHMQAVREQAEAEKQRRFAQKQQKRKEKHKGR